jgi:arylsulfatase A-like enzyme
VGAILRALKATGQAENTLIVFVSDNGSESVRKVVALPLGHAYADDREMAGRGQSRAGATAKASSRQST